MTTDEKVRLFLEQTNTDIEHDEDWTNKAHMKQLLIQSPNASRLNSKKKEIFNL